MPDLTHKNFLIKKPSVVFSFSEVNETSVEKIINNIQAKQSSDAKNLSTFLIKLVKKEILAILTLAINQSLQCCIFPDSLKIAKVIPILKKDDPTLVNNFRPISLLPVLSKIFEKKLFLTNWKNTSQQITYFTIVNTVSEKIIPPSWLL